MMDDLWAAVLDDLPFKVVRSNDHDELLERSTNVLMSRAAFEKAIELYPKELILLQQGARIIAKSSELDPAPAAPARRSSTTTSP